MTFGPGGVGPYGDRSRWGWALRRSVPVGLGPTAIGPGGVGPYGDRSRWGWALRRSVRGGLRRGRVGPGGVGPSGDGPGGVGFWGGVGTRGGLGFGVLTGWCGDGSG